MKKGAVEVATLLWCVKKKLKIAKKNESKSVFQRIRHAREMTCLLQRKKKFVEM
jgi:hypothetical protein